jgi:hypothetical protein
MNDFEIKQMKLELNELKKQVEQIKCNCKCNCTKEE